MAVLLNKNPFEPALEHVIVVIHQAISMAPSVEATAYLTEHAQPLESVSIINHLTPISS